MLKIYTARTVQEGAEAVLIDIKEKSGKNIVIVPDPFTLAVETTVAEKLGAKGVFDVEVMSFARLAAVTLGGQIKKCLSPAGCVMLLEKVIRSHAEKLDHFQYAAKTAGFAAEMYAAITALRNSGVEPAQLEAVAGKLTGYLSKKTREIALLYSAYLKELTEEHADSTTRLEALVDAIRHPDRYPRLGLDFGDVNFHVIDHVDLNRKQLEVVLALAEQARSVTVAVAVPNGAENSRIYPKLYSKLKSRATSFLTEDKPIPTSLTGDRERISRELFAYSFSEGKGSLVSLFEAKDMNEEVTCLATEITRLVREEGLRYSDVAIITPAFSEYLPYLERIFPYYEIPFFPDARYPLEDCSFFRHLIQALRIVQKGFEQTAERAFVCHPLFTRVTAAEKAAFCDYLDKAGVARRDPRIPFTLFKDDPLFPVANRVLASLAEEIEPLLALPEEATVETYTQGIKAFLLANDYAKRLTDYTNALTEGVSAEEKASLAKQSEILRHTLPAIVDLLGTMEELRGDETIPLSDFLLAFSAGAGQIKLAALPVSLDSVYFAAVEQAMYAPIPRLFVIGAEETLFPLERIKEGILGSAEYAAWQSCDVELKVENTEVEALSASKFHALQLLLRADKLALSHVGGRNASPCFGQLGILFDVKVKSCSDRLKEYSTEILIPTETVAKNMLIEYLRKEKEGLLDATEEGRLAALRALISDDLPPIFDAAERLSPTRASELFFRKGSVNATEIESYFYCPFGHFVRYGLGAREKQVAEAGSRDLGSFAHDCVETFVREHVMVRPKGDISDQEADAIARKIARKIVDDEPKYQAIEEREGKRVIAQEIARCGKVAVTVKNQIYASDFEPRFLETDFGYGYGDPAKGPFSATIRPEGLRLTGRMDRVDVLDGEKGADGRTIVSAVDYKTGSNESAPSDWYMGVKIQLPLYLEVLAACGYEPIAALYASLNTNRKTPYFIGPINNEKGVTASLDLAALEGKSPYTGMSVKDGALTGKLLLSDEAFRAVRGYVVSLTEQAIREIRSGCVAPSPIKNRDDRSPCENCAARNLCRHADELPRRKVKEVKEEDFPSIAWKGEKK